jgi:site-specific recombinase XerD
VALEEYLDWIDDYSKKNADFAKKTADVEAFFLSLQGSRISVRAVENLVKKYAQIISPLKKITPHKLRSTFGTGLYRDTRDIYIVADILGHKDINTTKKHYAATSDDIRRDVAKTLKLRKDD